MRITLEATLPAKTRDLWRTVAVATVEGNGKNVPVQFRLGDRSYGTMVNANWEGIAVKEVFLPEGQSTISAHLPDGASQAIVVTAGSPQAANPTEIKDEKEQKAPNEEESKKKDPPQYTVALEQSEPNKISNGLWGVTVTAVVRRGKNPISGVELRFEPPATTADMDQWDETDAGGIAKKTYELPAGVHTITARLKETGASKPAVVKVKEENPKRAARLYWVPRGKGLKQCIDFRALTADEVPVSGVPICITDPTRSDWKEEKKTDQYGAASFLIDVNRKVTVLCASAPGCESETIRLYNP